MRVLVFIVTALALAGCGGSIPVEPSPGPVSLEPVLVDLTAEPVRRIPLDEAAIALAVTPEGAPLVASRTSVRRLVGDQLERLQVIFQEGDPAPPAEIYDVAPRQPSGGWVATDAGLYAAGPLYIGFTGGQPDAVAVREVDKGALAGRWAAYTAALVRDDFLGGDRYDFPDIAPLTGLALAPDGERALLAGSEVELLVPEGDKLVRWLVPSTARPSRVAASIDGLWVLSSGKLQFLERSAEPDRWQEVVLPELVDLATGPRAVGLGADGTVYLLAPQEVTAVGRVDPMEGVRTAADPASGAWAAVETELLGFGLGAPRFDTVRPFITTHCARCHGPPGPDYLDPDVFIPLAGDALARVRSGDMPRCGDGGVRCPEPLPAEVYAPLEDWIRGGKLP